MCPKFNSWKTEENVDTHGHAWMLSMQHRKKKKSHTTAVHSQEMAVEQKCCDVNCFLCLVSAISGDVCLCCCLFLVHQLFNLSNKWGADDQACQTPDGRFAYEDSASFFFLPPCFCLSPINAFIHKPHFSLAADDKPGARPITGTLLATVTTVYPTSVSGSCGELK